MLRDFKFMRRNAGKQNEEIENVPANPRDTMSSHASSLDSSSSSSRPPLNTIQEPTTKFFDKTPTKPKSKPSDPPLALRTPDKHGFSLKQRFGWNESREEAAQHPRGGGLQSMTPNPRITRTVARGNSGISEANSTQSTPNKSVSKPVSLGFRSKASDGNNSNNVSNYKGNFGALYRGVGGSGGGIVVNTVEVPHFEMKEDPSFWMDHNVQVLIRVRPLNDMERSMHGYNRCLKQESSQSITWIGQPESRLTFDHVACETVDQETLFRMAGLPMVENCLSGYNSCMFAYGQTGSGKTYTMLGDIDGLEFKPSPQRGMTPRIFEFLFARIQAEEESRRDERLKYYCKCSFLEIYNEQITDLLDPSSTNLLLREDVKQGVYVENLSEFEVQTVSDILKLLTQGSQNRRVAATNMNRESSRSHSVFTCVIESRWEKDSTTNLRFARLNLVDLAGSERQKSSGAEGERLKEAASINKSLSTLGHVIMILVDVAHGKQRHVPYRDSRLTFLLQDSLGGNSKTMIIANVSPSICCAVETLNTLKFAQRAKLIQNNAVVNEGSTGDIIALQQQIQLLKEELFALKRQNVSRSLSFGSTAKDTPQAHDNTSVKNIHQTKQQHVDDLLGFESKGIVRMSTKQLKSLETTLAGALRREQMAETSIKKLEAEIEHLNRLVRQREEDTRSSKMMLRFREDKIQRMESLVSGSLPQDTYLLEDNKALREEIQLLQAKVDKNPEVTRFALENIRLLDQIRRFQEFYEEGEREILLDEISNLRQQLLQILDVNTMQHNHPVTSDQPEETMTISMENNSFNLELKNTLNELEECRHNLNSCLEENQRLSREINDLHIMLDDLKSVRHDQNHNTTTIKDLEPPPFEHGILGGVQNKVENSHTTSEMKHTEEILGLQLELEILKIILKEERLAHSEVEERAICSNRDLDLMKEEFIFLSNEHEGATRELKEVKSVVDALESQQILAINELDDLRKINSHYMNLVNDKELEIIALREELSGVDLRDLPSNNSGSENYTLQRKLKRMQDSLDMAKRLNMWYKDDHVSQASNEEEMDVIRRQAEGETAEVIVCMQEELSILQQQVQDCNLKEMKANEDVMLMETELKELQEKFSLLNEDNERLYGELKEKDHYLKKLSDEWEFLACEMEVVLADGQEALTEASDQADLISSSFPQKRIWISEQVGKLIRTVSEKELLIDELGKCLEEANNKRCDVESMLKSLRGAAMVISEAHQQECNEKERENFLLKSQLQAKMSTITELAAKLKLAEQQANKASLCATVAFVVVSRMSEANLINLNELNSKEVLLEDQAAAIKEAEKEIGSLRMELVEFEETCAELRQRLSEEEKRTCAIQEKLEDFEKTDILMATEKVAELKTGVSMLRSSMNMYPKHDNIQETNEVEGASSPTSRSTGCTDAGLDLMTNASKYSPKVGRIFGSSSSDQKFQGTSNNTCNRNVTIGLLKAEIEFALESLKAVQVEMAKLQKEKEEISMSEKQSQENMKCLTTQILALQGAISNFENQFEAKMNNVNSRLKASEKVVQEAATCWGQTKELLELEVGDAKITATQNAAEAYCIYAKLEEAQDTMKEADIMINGLMIANETMKLDMKRLKKIGLALTNERDTLSNEVQSLQSSNLLKEQQYEELEKQFDLSLSEMRDLIVEVEAVKAQLETTFKENFLSMMGDFKWLKTLILDSRKLVRSWLEDIWSEIIVKDSAISVLHLCHMGILLETVTGLNAENGLLQHGLCESNSLIADLREHNSKSGRELQMCRSLQGKLLADIKNSFDRISRKEEETGQLGLKLTTFDKKILDLQLQEELMLRRSNYMGSQLTTLMKELDVTNSNVIESLVDQEKTLKDKDDLLNTQAELFMLNLCSKEFESFILASRLEEITCQKVVEEREHYSVLENLKKETICSIIDAELKEQVLMSQEAELALLRREVEQLQSGREKLLSMLNQSNLRVAKMNDVNKALDGDFQMLKDAARSNDLIREEMAEVMETNSRLSKKIQMLDTKCEKLLNDLRLNKTALEEMDHQKTIAETEYISCGALLENVKKEMILLMVDRELKEQDLIAKEAQVSLLHKELEEGQREAQHLLSKLNLSLLKVSELDEVNRTLEVKSQLLKDISEANEMLKTELGEALETKATLFSQVQALEVECGRHEKDLRTKQIAFDNVSNCISSVDRQKLKLQEDVCTLENSLRKLQSDLGIKDEELRRMSHLEEENNLLKSEVCKLKAENSLVLQDLESHAKELISNNTCLQAELSRKEDILKGLLFDLSLLQESSSNAKDQKDKLEEMMASLEALEDELVLKSDELDELVTHCQVLESDLEDKTVMISTLELELAKERESLKKCSCENQELKSQFERALTEKRSLEDELIERKHLTDSLEKEHSHMCNSLGQSSNSIESLRKNLTELAIERDQLHVEMHGLNEKLQNALARAKENEAIAAEAQQIAESRKIYAEDKEAEIKLLERSVEELERTINVLERKVDILKGEAERQRLEREDLEGELNTLNHQMHSIRSADDDMKRHLDEREKHLEQALKDIQILEQDMADKDAEIAQFRAHISELNLHAEAQASEYKQKFKALEGMIEQVKPEAHLCHSNSTNSSSNKSEKNAAKSRGSSSPFKCIGLGMGQQIKTEKDEELTAAKLHIEELESLAVNRQKEIFALNARLAAAESMTHDVIRDLLGVKLDMTNYVSLLDNQQVQKIAEKAQLSSLEPRAKANEVTKLKQQLNEFIEERQGWLEEIDRKQAEMVAAQIALEKLRQRDQLLKTENDMLKMENVNHKKRVLELEGEIKKLSGQQNLHQRIHHHAKIKDENNLLKLQNEDLSAKLRRVEVNFTRVKEELAHYRSSCGKSPYINFEEEQRLINKLKETEDDRVQLAQKLLGLCTSVLKAAGITKHVSNITPSDAEDALQHLKDRLTSLESEVRDLTLKNRISSERTRMSELIPQTSTDENCQSPRKIQSPFLSALDR